VKVTGKSKGKGYAGVVKRHSFAGLPFSHGNGEYRNHPGSSAAQGPQHVFPGTKKPGHLGHNGRRPRMLKWWMWTSKKIYFD